MSGAKIHVPAVGYVRMSSDKQDASPKQQRQEIQKLADREGYVIVRWYEDLAISGDDTGRRINFQQMIHDAAELRDFKAILCWDQDRFGRFDSLEAGRWIDPLRKARVALVTVAQGRIDWNSFTGRLMYTIVQEGKHQYLVDLSRNVLRGRIESAKRGSLVVQPAYGYDRVFYDANGAFARRVPYGEKFNRPEGWTVTLEPTEDAEKIATIRWLFDTYAHTDSSLRWLVTELNRRNIPAPRGKGWSSVAVRYMLTNRAYLGHRTFGTRRSGKYHQVGGEGEIVEANGTTAKGVAVIIAENKHEPLIDQETFDLVQRKLAERGERNEKTRASRFVLTGVIRCGHCGRAMCGQSTGARGRDSGRAYYRCPGGMSGRCQLYAVRKEQIEEYILGYLTEWLTNPSAVPDIEQGVLRRHRARKVAQSNAKTLGSRIATLDKKIARGRENLLLADSDNVPELSSLLSDWRAERDGLQAELNAMGSSGDNRTEQEAVRRAIGEMKRLNELLRTGEPAKVRLAVKTLVAGVSLQWEQRGTRYRQVSHGTMDVRTSESLMEGSSSIVFGYRPRETGGP